MEKVFIPGIEAEIGNARGENKRKDQNAAYSNVFPTIDEFRKRCEPDLELSAYHFSIPFHKTVT